MRGYSIDEFCGITLGRSATADVVLNDPRVSRLHAEVRPEGGWLRITDLGSANGFRVDGSLATTALMAHDDCIDIGPFRIQVANSEVADTAIIEPELSQLGAQVGDWTEVELPHSFEELDSERVTLPSS